MAAPSSPCGDPASAAGHEDLHGGVEATAPAAPAAGSKDEGERAALDRAPPPTGTGVIPSSSSVPVPGPLLAFRRRRGSHRPPHVPMLSW
jgi:hypothetical protein